MGSLVQLWVVGCAGPRAIPGRQLLAAPSGVYSISRQAEPHWRLHQLHGRLEAPAVVLLPAVLLSAVLVLASGWPTDLIVVLDGTPTRLEQAERYRRQLLHEPERLLIRCPRSASPPPRSPPWPAVASRSSPIPRPRPAPANAASSSAMPCASASGAPPAAPAPSSCPKSLPANGQIVGCRGGVGLVKAPQELFRLQAAQVFVPAGFAGGCEGALPSPLSSTGVL